MLARIAIRGFKSFAEPVVLELVPGINVVVGPNGSGKSNVVEAVLWALGEQRARHLRAGAMGDVLFSGGEGRPPGQIAQVGLTLGEAEGAPELEVARRLTREGDATYRISGQSCRLLDVQEALAARGLGPDALAIVRQGQVDSVCTAGPAELRAIVDEAAGIAGSKRRRRRALRRLAHMQDRLARARDIRNELTTQARRLERQAAAATRAAELDRAIAEGRAALAEARRAEALRELAAAEAERRRRSDASLAAARERDSAQSASGEAAAAARAASERLEGAAEIARRLRSAGDRVAGRAEVLVDRLAAARGAAERAERARERLTELAEAERDALAAQEAARAALAERESVLTRAEEAHRAASAAAARLRADADAAAREREEADRRAGAAGRRVAALEAELERVAAAAREATPLPDVERAARREEVATGRRERWRGHERAAEADAAEARALAEAAAERARAAKARAAAARPSATREDDAALGSGLEVEEGMERAVAAALGSLASARPRADLAAAVRALADGADAVAVPANPRSDPGAPGRSVWEAVRACPDAARVHLEALLRHVRVVDDLSEVPAGAAGSYVTREGLAYHGARGSVGPAGAEWAMQARHRRLVREAEEAAVAAQEAGEEARRAERARDGVRGRRRAAERSATRAERALEAARATASRVAKATAEREARAAALRDDLTEARAALAAAEERRASVADAAGPSPEEAEQAARAAVAARDAAREALAGARDAVSRADGASQEAVARHARARGEAGATPAVAIAEAAPAVAAVERLARTLLERADAADGELAAARGAATEAGSAVQRAGSAAARAREAEAQAREALARAEGLAEAAAARAREIAGEDDPWVERVALGEAAPEGPPAGDLAAEVAQLETARERLGPVNALAESERAELSEREGELGEQLEDLEKAEAALLERLEELEAAVAEGFEETFGTLSERFREVVEVLFPGGTGVLGLVEDPEGGEPGVSIEVVPAGKRPRSLALMSGGERSLIALAFCLALAQTRTAPVYLLDEVEAALDDVNLRRFLGLVRKLATTTQFILVTHQQPTVEIADAIYGVTMRDGVSQVVSRRLDQRVEGPARPFVRRRLRAVAGGREA